MRVFSLQELSSRRMILMISRRILKNIKTAKMKMMKMMMKMTMRKRLLAGMSLRKKQQKASGHFGWSFMPVDLGFYFSHINWAIVYCHNMAHQTFVSSCIFSHCALLNRGSTKCHHTTRKGEAKGIYSFLSHFIYLFFWLLFLFTN